jgi:hypothetical protein
VVVTSSILKLRTSPNLDSSVVASVQARAVVQSEAVTALVSPSPKWKYIWTAFLAKRLGGSTRFRQMALKYRLDLLGWYSFESLVLTLLKAVIGSGVTSLGGAKDSGQDASFVGKASFPSKDTSWEGQWIFQVKYSQLETLTRAEGSSFLRRITYEVLTGKDRRGSWPDNYVLITSFRVTSSFRKRLKDAVARTGFAGNFRCIDGREICELLDVYPHVRRGCPQLLGLADLEHALDRDIRTRSAAFVSFWGHELIPFVPVRQYLQAVDVIGKYNFVVIDGPPESGKSYIGAALALTYAVDGYEVHFINEPSEILRTYEPARKQLFFADDAVGTVTFDPDLGNLWSRELRAINRRLDRIHKLIWTTRSYILKEAISLTKLEEHFDSFPGEREVLVETGDYSLVEKALMLRNHARTANLSKSFLGFVRRNAMFICTHSHFTPERLRLIIRYLRSESSKELAPSKENRLRNEINVLLTTPTRKLERAYSSLPGKGKMLLLTLLDLGSPIEIEKLRKEYERRAFV